MLDTDSYILKCALEELENGKAAEEATVECACKYGYNYNNNNKGE